MTSHLTLRHLIPIVCCILAGTRCASADPVINSTADATSVNSYTATVGANVAANGEKVTWYIEYGLTTSYGKKSAVQAVDAGTFSNATFGISGLEPQKTYHYRCKATGVTTHKIVTGADKSFTTPAAVAVVADSAPKAAGGELLVVGEPATLSMLNVDGTPPFKYQWKRNGANRGAATANDTLTIPSVVAGDSGAWTCLVSNPGSSDLSPPVFLTTAAVTPLPTKVIAEGGTFTSTATLTPAPPNVKYRWYSKGNPNLVDIGTVTGADGPKFTVTGATLAAAGEYTCEVTVDELTVQVPAGTIVIGAKPVVQQISNLDVRVSQTVNLDVVVLNNPTAVSVKGLPIGLKYSFATGKITGKATTHALIATKDGVNSASIKIFATNAYGKSETMSFVIGVLDLQPGVAGTFNGTFERTADSKKLGGKARAVVSSTGAISGAVTIGTAAYPFAGSVESTYNNIEVSFALNHLKSGKNPQIDVALTFDPNDGGKLLGTVTGPEGEAKVTGQRVGWTVQNPFGNPGTYNCAFTPADLGVPQTEHPRGISIGILTVTNLGVATLKGRLADGTKITCASAMGPAGELPLYVSLYGGKGSLLGQPFMDNGGILQDAVTWNKDVSAGGRAYGPGFKAFDMDTFGALYVKPKAVDKDLVFSMPPDTKGAVLSFLYADISKPPEVTFDLSSTYAAQIPKASLANPTPNPFAVTVKLNAATGEISGTFKVTQPDKTVLNKNVTRTGTYYGISVPASKSGFIGFFTIPDMPVPSPPSAAKITTNPVQTGSLELDVPPLP